MQKKCAAMRSGELIGGMMDILFEIFQYLPVKTLISFKLVSKLWKLLISNPNFCIHHFRLQLSNQPIKTPSGFYFYSCLTNKGYINKHDSVSLNPQTISTLPSLSYLDIICQRTSSCFTILQSLNGLLLCRFLFPSRLCIHVVTNPITRAIHALPFLSNTFDPEASHDEAKCGYRMVFDSGFSDHIRVFCIKIINNYGPFTRYSYSDGGHCMIYMYSFESEIWEPIHDSNLHSTDIQTRGVYCDGGIYLIGEELFLHYDIKGNQLKITYMPPKPKPQDWEERDTIIIRYFGESRGHLHLIQVRSAKSVKFSILELDKEKWKWFVRYSVHLGGIMKAFPDVVIKDDKYEYIKKHTFSILGVVREENEDDSVLVMAIPGKVIAYNLKHKNVKQLSELPILIYYRFRFVPVSSFQYAQSLFPIRQRSFKYDGGHNFVVKPEEVIQSNLFHHWLIDR